MDICLCPWFCGCPLAETCGSWPQTTMGQLAPQNAVINVESNRQDEDIGHNKIYKEGLGIKRNDNPRTGPSKGIGTIGNVVDTGSESRNTIRQRDQRKQKE